MSKKVGFPVMSTMITAILFVLGLLLATLNILILAVVGTGAVYAAIWFIALFLFGWGLLSFSLNPELEDYQRNVAFFFVVLLVAALLTYGVSISVSIA